MLFSVIVPMYNVKPYANECIDSIINQSFKDFELIIVDDGSSDGTSEIIDNYKQKDARIIAIHKKNGGLTSARKAGAKVAKGDYVVIVDGDDWIGHDYLESFAKVIFADYPEVIICGYTKCIGTEEEPIQVKCYDEGTYTTDDVEWNTFIENKLMHFMPTVWSKCFRRENYYIVQNLISDEISMGEDGCISYPLIANAKKISICNSTQYFYRFNPTSLTNSRNKVIPLEATKWRIIHLHNNLPRSEGFKRQLSGFAAHALFNSVTTNFRNNDYQYVVKKTKYILNDTIVSQYFLNKTIYGSRLDKVAHFVLRKRLFALIKVYSSCKM